MRPIGFSTGALARGDFSRGLELLKEAGLRNVELSALRREELPGLMHYIQTADLGDFDYVSIHAPSAYPIEVETKIAEDLTPAIEKNLHVVVHPDSISNFEPWRRFGRLLCIENMDKRKPTGRTVPELREIFERLPEASLCLDVAHSRQVDPTMGDAADILRKFASRLAQVHVSDVNSSSEHERLNLTASMAFQKIAASIPTRIPLVLESPLYSEPASRIQGEIAAEIARTENVFTILGAERKREISDVWRAFRKSRTPVLMRILMMEYLPLVSDYAKNLRSTLPVELDLDDLMQAGSFGLKEAIESFDPNQGAKFETHCVPRIRGAILDEWRNMDWAPGPVSGRSSGDIQTSWQLETKPGRASTEEEIPAHLVVPADESGKKRNDSDAVSEVSRSRKWFEAESDKDIRRIGAPRNRDSDSPLAMLHQPDLKELLTSGLSRLEKMILVLHYHEGMAMKEIGDALELTESKVADLHADVIAHLKKRLADPDFMLAILGR